MRLLQLRAENFRLLQSLSLQLHGRLNFVFGCNTAGKTSFLESVYVLGRGRSFRGSSPQDIAGVAGPQWVVFGRIQNELATARQSVGLRWNGSETEIRLDGQAASSLELLRTFPVQVLEPGTHKVLQEGPTYRRSFLDWGVFHVEPQFMSLWRRYRRALRQRNQLLRAQVDDRQLAAWEPELAEAGEALDALRRAHLDSIRATVASRAGALLGEGEWSFELHSGWPRGLAFGDALARHRAADRRMALTQQGPHRAELRIRANGRAAKNRISRGQQKLLIAALLLAQSEEIGSRSGRSPVLLVDDFAAELADAYQSRLLSALRTYPGQVFVTAFERSGVLAQDFDCAMFHVEHGAVTRQS